VPTRLTIERIAKALSVRPESLDPGYNALGNNVS